MDPRVSCPFLWHGDLAIGSYWRVARCLLHVARFMLHVGCIVMAARFMLQRCLRHGACGKLSIAQCTSHLYVVSWMLHPPRSMLHRALIMRALMSPLRGRGGPWDELAVGAGMAAALWELSIAVCILHLLFGARDHGP